MARISLLAATILGGLALGVAAGLASSSRPRRRELGVIRDVDPNTGANPVQLYDFEARARAAGARGELDFIGAGAEGFVMCDEHGKAFKAAWPGKSGLADEARWLAMAGQIPSIKQHVPKAVSYNAEERVLVRECLVPRPAPRGTSRAWPNERKLWDLHQRLTATMAPYGFGRPEFKPDSYVYTTRGPVLVDAGFAVNRGGQLVKEALATLKRETISKADAEDLAFALRMERGETVPEPVANKLLLRLQARDPNVRLDG